MLRKDREQILKPMEVNAFQSLRSGECADSSRNPDSVNSGKAAAFHMTFPKLKTKLRKEKVRTEREERKKGGQKT